MEGQRERGERERQRQTETQTENKKRISLTQKEEKTSPKGTTILFFSLDFRKLAIVILSLFLEIYANPGMSFSGALEPSL